MTGGTVDEKMKGKYRKVEFELSRCYPNEQMD